jgi:hypothetical protein
MDKVVVLLKELQEAPEPLLDEVLDFVKFLKHKRAVRSETALLSEAALAKDWSSSEEEQAWQDL